LFKAKSYLGGLAALVAVALLVVLVWVTAVKGQSNDQVGIVDMQTIFMEYMIEPLYEARDKMQAEYDAKAESLTDEEAADLFMQYQAQLEAIELEYTSRVEAAIAQVAKENGCQVVIEASAVLYGGVDMTADVLKILQ